MFKKLNQKGLIDLPIAVVVVLVVIVIGFIIFRTTSSGANETNTSQKSESEISGADTINTVEENSADNAVEIPAEESGVKEESGTNEFTAKIDEWVTTDQGQINFFFATVTERTEISKSWVTPGRILWVGFTIKNTTNQRQVYNASDFEFIDPSGVVIQETLNEEANGLFELDLFSDQRTVAPGGEITEKLYYSDYNKTGGKIIWTNSSGQKTILELNNLSIPDDL